jgi:hypothetical protein
MRTASSFLIAALSIAAIVLPAAGAQEKPAPPESQPAAPERTIPELKLDNVPFDELIQFLRQADPDFQVVVAHEGGPGPIIQELWLKNVTASQVLQVVGRTYGFADVRPAGSSAKGTIWSVRTVGPRQPSGPPQPAEQAVTGTFRLRDTIDGVASELPEKDRKEATLRILSLLEMALRADYKTDNSVLPKIQLHEPTETLVFHGSREQMSLVRDTLQSLTPRQSAPPPRPSASDALLKRIAELERRLGIVPEPNEPATQASPAPRGGPVK